MSVVFVLGGGIRGFRLPREAEIERVLGEFSFVGGTKNTAGRGWRKTQTARLIRGELSD